MADTIAERYCAGATLEEAAATVGMSRQRATVYLKEFYDYGLLIAGRRMARRAWSALPSVTPLARPKKTGRPRKYRLPPMGAVVQERLAGMTWTQILQAHDLPHDKARATALRCRAAYWCEKNGLDPEALKGMKR